MKMEDTLGYRSIGNNGRKRSYRAREQQLTGEQRAMQFDRPLVLRDSPM